MKKLFIAVCSITVAFVLSSCGPKDIQPVQALSDTVVGNVNVKTVNVRWNVAHEDLFMQEQEGLKELQLEYDNAAIKTRKERSSRKTLKKKLNKKRNRVEGMEKKNIEFSDAVKVAIENSLALRLRGETDVDVNVVLSSVSMTNSGFVFLVGGSDSMTGTVGIINSETQDVLGEYVITDYDSNAAGGLLGVMVRGTDPRGDMIKQFSDKVVEAIYGYAVR